MTDHETVFLGNIDWLELKYTFGTFKVFRVRVVYDDRLTFASFEIEEIFVDLTVVEKLVSQVVT